MAKDVEFSRTSSINSPFCSLCVIFVILIRIYRMVESVHARERAREGFAVAKEKTGFRLFYTVAPGLRYSSSKPSCSRSSIS